MGPTGAGKSSVMNSYCYHIVQSQTIPQIINRIAGKDVVKIGHGLESCTSSIRHVIIPHPTDKGRRIILIDTPGFDDTYISDADILECIALWLARS